MRFPVILPAAVLLAGAAVAQTPGQPSNPSAPVQAQGQAPKPTPVPAPVPPGGQPSAAASAPAPDQIIAKVNGTPLRISDLQDAARALPEPYRRLPQATLYPMLLDEVIDRQAVAQYARKQGLENDPAVHAQIMRAEDQVLQTALVTRDVAPLVTEQALKARYDATVAGKPGEQEVHALHILVPTEEEAKSLIAEINKGGDFSALAKAHSKDPGAANGGDLGFFKQADMVPEFASVAFSLKPGQVSQTPVKTQFGWHVIKVLEVRQAPPPTFDQARDQIRTQIVQDAVQKILTAAKQGVTIEKFNLDGSPQRSTDSAEPPAPVSK